MSENKHVCRFYLAFLALAVMLCFRLYHIATDGSRAQTVLAGQYTRRLDVAARYGGIYDRNGVLLSDDKIGYRTVIDASALSERERYELSERLANTGDQPQSYYLEKLFANRVFTVDTEKSLPKEYGKSYPLYRAKTDRFLRHVLGYRDADGIGMAGIARTYDEYLRETTAARVTVRYEADAHGGVMEGSFPVISDERYDEREGIVLTIDAEIQKAVEQICDESLDRGAVVVESIESGELLAVCSRPTYSLSELSELLTSERGELLNRAFLAYTPGSVFKIVVAAAALEKDPDAYGKSYVCDGSIDVDGQIIRCHDRAGHGSLSMREGFALSCNPYFIDCGLSLGKNAIKAQAEKLGLFRYDTIHLLPTDSGSFPQGATEIPAQTANLSVGQGELTVTPVQVCNLVVTAVSGVYHKPSIVGSLVNGEFCAEYGADIGEQVLTENTVAHLRQFFTACVTDGTGYRALSDTVSCGGKTATAQSGQKKDGKEVIHSWFAGYFPADDPKIAVCVLCDGNGENTTHSSEIFKNIAEAVAKLVDLPETVKDSETIEIGKTTE